MVMSLETYFGRAEHRSGAGPWTLTKGSARYQQFTPSGAALVSLPPLSTMKKGGPHFFIRTANGQLLDVQRAEDETPLFTLASASLVAEFWVQEDASGDPTWTYYIHPL